MGTAHFVIVGGALVELAGVAAGSTRALVVLAWALIATLVLPGLALVLTGLWDLARGPLRHFATRLRTPQPTH